MTSANITDGEAVSKAWLNRLSLVALLAVAVFSYWPDREAAADHVAGDSPHYIYSTLNLVNGQGLVDIFHGRKYPPEHSFGLPLLMAGFYWLLGTHPGNGIYAVFLMGIGSVLLVYLIGTRLFSRTAGFMAGLFLAGAEAFRWFAKHVMTDVPAAFFWLAAMWVALSIKRDPKASFWRWAVLGHIIGFGIAVRSEDVLVLLPIAVFAFLERKRQERWLLKTVILASGLAMWVAAILVTNHIYTGSWTRTPQQVKESFVYDRPDHGFGWRFAISPSWRDGNVARYLGGALHQWSLLNSSNTAKMLYFYGLSLLACLGLIVAIRRARTEDGARDFLMWLGLSFAAFILFFSVFIYFADRLMLRLVPLMCLLDGIGVAAAISAFRRSNCAGKTALACVALPFAAGYGYALLHPVQYRSNFLPTTAFLQRVSEYLPSNSVLVSGINAWAMEELAVAHTERVFLPLNRSTSGADTYCAWHPPPHPEWIPNDTTVQRRYPRMFENGIEEVYPQTAADNPEVIDTFLSEGRPVFLVGLGLFTDDDAAAATFLENRFRLQLVNVSLPGARKMPGETPARIWRQEPFIVRVWPKKTG